MNTDGIASDTGRKSAAAMLRDELVANEAQKPESNHTVLLARMLERGNLQRALKRVRQNQGAPGIDGMSVDELPGHRRRHWPGHHWPEIRAQLEAGCYCPQPVKRVEIEKADGKKRPLGITVNARKIAVDRPWNRTFLGFTVSRNGTKLNPFVPWCGRGVPRGVSPSRIGLIKLHLKCWRH